MLIRLAQALQNHEYGRESLVTLRMALDCGGSDLDPTLALKIARAARRFDSETARFAAELALRQPDIDPAIRAQTEQLLQELPPSRLQPSL